MFTREALGRTIEEFIALERSLGDEFSTLLTEIEDGELRAHLIALRDGAVTREDDLRRMKVVLGS